MYRQLDLEKQETSLIHIIQEDELEENNARVSSEARMEATEVLNAMVNHKDGMEVTDNG